ncbi:hypothetical protein AAG906_018987 [Vitis piasezkii]
MRSKCLKVPHVAISTSSLFPLSYSYPSFSRFPLNPRHSYPFLSSPTTHIPYLPHICHQAHTRFSSAGPISLFACGGVVTWGRGTSGQLGHGDLVSSLQPKHVKLLESFPLWFYYTGCLFTCGDGSFGQLGHGDCKSHGSSVEVSYFNSKHVDQMACGMRHSLVLLKGLSGDQVYGFGSGKRGQLGVSMDNTRSISLPQATVGLEGVEIISIGANGDHSAALSVDGHLYTWERGFGSTSDVHYPRCLPSSLCGGEVFMLGGNHHGVRGDPQKGSQMKHLSEESREENLKKVQGLDGLNVVHEHRVTKTWDRGEHGQLGLGNTYDQISSQAVRLGHRLPGQHTMIKVYCGSRFTFAIKAAILSP